MYTSFTIENFRLFDQLTVEPLARVNLIAGQNNAGKTALLEALWLHNGQNNPELAQRINFWRGLPGSEPGGLFSDLFRDYHTDLPIKLTSKWDRESEIRTLTIALQHIAERTTTLTPTLSAGTETRRSPPERIYEHEILFEYIDGVGNPFSSRAWVELTPLPFELPVPPGSSLTGT